MLEIILVQLSSVWYYSARPFWRGRFEIIKLILARIFQLLTEILLNNLTNPHFCREDKAERASLRNGRAETAVPNSPIPTEICLPKSSTESGKTKISPHHSSS